MPNLLVSNPVSQKQAEQMTHQNLLNYLTASLFKI
jgi:hypothetical protein